MLSIKRQQYLETHINIKLLLKLNVLFFQILFNTSLKSFGFSKKKMYMKTLLRIHLNFIWQMSYYYQLVCCTDY